MMGMDFFIAGIVIGLLLGYAGALLVEEFRVKRTENTNA